MKNIQLLFTFFALQLFVFDTFGQISTSKKTDSVSYAIPPNEKALFVGITDNDRLAYFYNTAQFADAPTNVYFRFLLKKSNKIATVKANSGTAVVTIETPHNVSALELVDILEKAEQEIEYIFRHFQSPHAEMEGRIARSRGK